MNTISIIISILAFVVSIIALWLQKQSEKQTLRISFLLPQLSQIVDSLRSLKIKEVKNGHPDAESMTEFWKKAKDICF